MVSATCVNFILLQKLLLAHTHIRFAVKDSFVYMGGSSYVCTFSILSDEETPGCEPIREARELQLSIIIYFDRSRMLPRRHATIVPSK